MKVNYIKLIRVFSGASQQEFARMLGISGSHLSKWEAGKIRPNTNSINKIVSLVGADNVRKLDSLVYSPTLIDLEESIKQKFQNKRGE
ncbi:helix-turn-helix domain-containing protein [Bacillus thuringiensis]|uniref:helix-turn-helix domain-containing protein n=1 Tax=Bacillus thuringiensis TaxID=1428 RepID=UPI0007C1B71A|nr:helix-turn-helix domain-containing protein [Bacillus thuringiensis]AND09792.1 hypothetical protein Bt4C1_22000 [Bacillus thuringiensis serovar alesti]MEC3595562.1 helix-turn-helix domain-containing protein [Bacillus thuringiensis]MED1836144.1 helix-turn-helix domain-containing protein [Bacillus thuringiensis]MED2668310.1 helix-turn-helix domain-containing protein [Bacillus thuringiensis]MED2695174.1 helix-turn-helix domain-containing protein [Bacillus thuringiensis]